MSEQIVPVAPGISLIYPVPSHAGWGSFLCTYLINGDNKALIDLGPRAAVPGLLMALEKANLPPKQIDYLIVTHIHLDHAGGAATALKSMPHAKVIMHPRGEKHMIDPSALWPASIETLGDLAHNYGEPEPLPADRIILASDGMKLDMGRGLELEFIFTPGHSSHHMCVFEKSSRAMFVGDAAGVPVFGILRLTTPPPFRLSDYIASIDRMIAMEPSIICYAHRGFAKDAVKELQACKTKLHLWYGIAQAGVKAGKTTQQVFEDIKQADLGIKKMFVNKDAAEHDIGLILQSIQGMMTSK
jgi:glyoxylase-like metal-dependent hydrolase (beta-lactamase superfamily II)